MENSLENSLEGNKRSKRREPRFMSGFWFLIWCSFVLILPTKPMHIYNIIHTFRLFSRPILPLLCGEHCNFPSSLSFYPNFNFFILWIFFFIFVFHYSICKKSINKNYNYKINKIHKNFLEMAN